MKLMQDWASMAIKGANEFIAQTYHPATALRAAIGPNAVRMTSDSTATISTWCPEARGLVSQDIILVNGKWELKVEGGAQ